MKKLLHTLFLAAAAILLVACQKDVPKYVIGVSQCSADVWREKQNTELRMAAYFHDNVELRFAAAYDSDERQVQQIDSLLSTGIDLLIVAPNQVATISPAIDRAYDQGIPVIVFERKTNSQKYTAFISADNYEMGRTMGQYIATQLKGRGRVMEIMGLKGSSPAIERHKGFADALKQYPGIECVATLQGDWTQESAVKAVSQWLLTPQGRQAATDGIDYVFGQNDRMAMGARQALTTLHSSFPKFCGIDGLPGQQGGIQLVADSLLDASYIYPTHGDQLLQQAIDILDGKAYNKEIMLMSALVTADNARVLQMENEEVMRQTHNLDRLHSMASGYRQQLWQQRIINMLALALFVVMLLAASALVVYLRQRQRLQHERTRLQREQLDFYTQVAHELRTPLTLIEGPLTQLAATPELQQASGETSSLMAIVRRNTSQLTQLINKMLEPPEPLKNEELRIKNEEFLAVQASKGRAATAAGNDSFDEVPRAATAADGCTELPTLLIVDDNADIRTYLHTILQHRYRLLEAEDGQKGLETARAEVPDLIVSDVMMPVMNGLEFCQRVKDDMVTSHIPVILLTARALSQHQVEGYRSGADAYMTKPFEAEVLMARIDNLLRQRIQLKDIWSSAPAASADEGGTAAEPKTEDPPEPTPAKTATPNTEAPFVQKFRKVVEEHLADTDFGVEQLGAELSLSRVQLYRKMKALTGKSPVELIRQVRLLKARHLLEHTDLTVSEVAYQTGFSAPSYFTKCFKDEFGMLPGDCRG